MKLDKKRERGLFPALFFCLGEDAAGEGADGLQLGLRRFGDGREDRGAERAFARSVGEHAAVAVSEPRFPDAELPADVGDGAVARQAVAAFQHPHEVLRQVQPLAEGGLREAERCAEGLDSFVQRQIPFLLANLSTEII